MSRTLDALRARPERPACAALAALLLAATVGARTRFAPAGLAFLNDPAWRHGLTLAALALLGVALRPASWVLPPGLLRALVARGPSPRAWPVAPAEPLSPRAVALHLLALVGLCALAFASHRDALLGGYDGAFYRVTTRLQAEWTSWGPYLGPHPLAGLGNSFFCANTLYSPGLALGLLAGGEDVNEVVTYTVIAAELFLSMCFLGACLQLDRRVALAGAWLLPLGSLPVPSTPPLYAISSIAPHHFEFMAAELVLLGAAYRIGRDGWRASVACLLVLVLGCLWVVVCSSMVLVLVVPPVAVAFVAFTLAAPTPRERWIKVATPFVLLALLAPVALHVAGVAGYSVPAYFPGELENDRVGAFWVSGLFHGPEHGWLTRPFLACGLLGGLLAARVERGALRLLALATLLQTGLTLALGGALALAPDYRGPSLIYFEHFQWPACALLAASLLLALGREALRAARWLLAVARGAPAAGGPSVWALHLLVAGAVWLAASIHGDARSAPPQLPCRETPIVRRLADELAVRPGDAFRGNVATFTGAPGEAGVGWLEQHRHDVVDLAEVTGNDHRAVGLWAHAIPTLHEYNQFMTPPYYAALSRLLARPQDRQMRSVIVLTRPDLPYLEALGVRFVITDAPWAAPGARLDATLPAGATTLRLYELPRPNLATYSPTRVTVAATAAEALARLRAPGFDFAGEAVLGEDLPGLVPATSSALRLERGGWVVTATSPGRSLLLLPLQFSRCLSLTVRSSAGSSEPPRLARVDLMQAGLVFSGAVEVEVRFASGPFHEPFGRLRDRADMTSLRLRELAR